jgi:hypothetical protein
MNLLIIGQGAWASKIQSVLNDSTSDINATSVSARVALEESSNMAEMLRDSEIIWICTKPDWQLKLLPKLNRFEGKLILEKPYIVNQLSVNQLSEFSRKFKGVLQISEPWTFSSVWSAAKKEINESKKVEFTIKRGGFTGHEFVPAVMDWLPHDINLLFDLYGAELMNSKVSNIHWKENRSDLEFQVSVRSGITFTLKVGEFEGGRVAQWESEDLKIDFQNSTVTQGKSKMNIVQEINPFILQIYANKEESSNRTQKQLEVQNYFFHKLFSAN